MKNVISPFIYEGSSPYKPPHLLWYVFAVYEDGETIWCLRTSRKDAREQCNEWKNEMWDKPVNCGYGQVDLMYVVPERGVYPW